MFQEASLKLKFGSSKVPTSVTPTSVTSHLGHLPTHLGGGHLGPGPDTGPESGLGREPVRTAEIGHLL